MPMLDELGLAATIVTGVSGSRNAVSPILIDCMELPPGTEVFGVAKACTAQKGPK
jgi:hypothetical protein